MMHLARATPSLIGCPIEIRVLILGQLSDLGTLLSAIETCQSLRDTYKSDELRILRSIFQRKFSIPAHLYGGLLQDLATLVRREVANRICVRSIFEDCWKEFKKKHLEELLIPVGRALAWSYVLNAQVDDAIKLLSKIMANDAPFEWWRPAKGTISEFNKKGREIRPTLYPIGSLLVQLRYEKGDRNPWYEFVVTQLEPAYDNLPTAVIEGMKIYDPEPFNDPSGACRDCGFRFSMSGEELFPGSVVMGMNREEPCARTGVVSDSDDFLFIRLVSARCMRRCAPLDTCIRTY